MNSLCKQNFKLAKAFLALSLGLVTGLAHAASSFSATAWGQLSIISITDSQGNDATSSFGISLAPTTPYVTDLGATTVRNAEARYEGTADSSLLSPSNPYYLDQRSFAIGNAIDGSASAYHSTSGELDLSLQNGTQDPITVKFGLNYGAAVFSNLDLPSLESASAQALFKLTDSLGMLVDGTVNPVNELSTDLHADAAGGFDALGNPIPASDSFSDPSLLFSVTFGPTDTFERITLVTQVSGNVQAVPIPAAVWLFGSALAGFGVFGTRRSKPA